MPLNPDKTLKLYYSIKEVAAMIGVNESTLRYWETELPQLKPKTQSITKVRQYTEKDIELLRSIYTLVKVRGFKLAAARKMINENRKGVDKSAEVLTTLISVRDQLKELKLQLDGLVRIYNKEGCHFARWHPLFVLAKAQSSSWSSCISGIFRS